jgi:hypothetical protein
MHVTLLTPRRPVMTMRWPPQRPVNDEMAITTSNPHAVHTPLRIQVAEIDTLIFLESCTTTQFGPNAAVGTSINANNWNAMQTVCSNNSLRNRLSRDACSVLPTVILVISSGVGV